MAKNFLRQEYMRHSRLGKNRKKLQKWRRPKGRHSKMRKMRGGYPTGPSVGHKSTRESRQDVSPLVHNLNEMKGFEKGKKITLAKVGAKKRLELIKFADEKGIIIKNIRRIEKNETK